MAPRFAAVIVLFPLACSGVAAEDAQKRVKGRVIDEAGRPFLGASVSALWGANGLTWNQVAAVRGTEPEKVWQNEGKMQPWSDASTVTDAEGRFSIDIDAPEGKSWLLAYDHDRRRGAMIVVDPS
jgi:hypothetical protein